MQKYNLILEVISNYNIEKKVTSPKDIKALVETMFNLSNQAEEVFILLGLSSKGDVIGALEISRGTINSSFASPREIFKRALALNAPKIVLSHNHPSGDMTPSNSDIEATRIIKEAGDILDIELIDHVIVSHNGYNSLKERGVL